MPIAPFETLRVPMPSGTMTVRRPTALNRLAVVSVQGRRVYGKVLEVLPGTNSPRRVLICHGSLELAGRQFLPSAFTFIGWADEEED